MTQKEELLLICAKCQARGEWDNQWKLCIFGDIEASKDEDISPPKCAITSERNRPPIDENPAAHRRETSNEERRPSTPPESTKGADIAANTLDPLDLKILKLIAEQHYESTIAAFTKRPRTTIKDRIRKLRVRGLIKPEAGNQHIKFYALSSRGAAFLVPDEKPTRNKEAKSPFSVNCSKWSFPLISGDQPKNTHPVKMRNWNGYDFKDNPLYTVRTSPRAVHVFVNVELFGASVEDLNEKYKALAIGYAGKFAEDHSLKVGAAKPYQKPHFTLKNNNIAKIITEVGTVQTPDMHFDKSRSSGDMEMSYETAKGLEFTLEKMPVIVAGLRAEMDETRGMIRDVVGMIQAFTNQGQGKHEQPPGYA